MSVVEARDSARVSGGHVLLSGTSGRLSRAQKQDGAPSPADAGSLLEADAALADRYADADPDVDDRPDWEREACPDDPWRYERTLRELGVSVSTTQPTCDECGEGFDPEISGDDGWCAACVAANRARRTCDECGASGAENHDGRRVLCAACFGSVLASSLCAICGRNPRTRAHRCETCRKYYQRNGVERPAKLAARQGRLNERRAWSGTGQLSDAELATKARRFSD